MAEFHRFVEEERTVCSLGLILSLVPFEDDGGERYGNSIPALFIYYLFYFLLLF